MPAQPPTSTPPATEDTFMAVLVAVGSVLRQRLPGYEHDFSLLPVLVELDRCGPVRHSDLADRLRLDASTVSRRVKHLAEQGLVAVTQDASDARARRVQIRPAGRKALAQLRSRRRDLLGEVMHGWDAEDRDELQRLLARFLDDLGELTGTGTPSPDHLTHPSKDATR
jgi:DNA-binding MarR family transcriptional regulator